MAYIIKNNEKDTYLVYNLVGGLSIYWTKNAESASSFLTEGKAQNFILHNYKAYVRRKKVTEESISIVTLSEVQHPVEVNTYAEAQEQLDNLPSPGELASQIKALMKYAGNVLSLADQEKNDILHKIELEEKLNAAERAMLFKQLREILQWRRTCKDMVAFLNQYTESGFLTACERLDAKLANFREQMASRVYTPRVLTDLFTELEAV